MQLLGSEMPLRFFFSAKSFSYFQFPFLNSSRFSSSNSLDKSIRFVSVFVISMFIHLDMASARAENTCKNMVLFEFIPCKSQTTYKKTEMEKLSNWHKGTVLLNHTHTHTHTHTHIYIYIYIYNNAKVKVRSLNGDPGFIDIVAGVLQGATFEPYLFLTALTTSNVNWSN